MFLSFAAPVCADEPTSGLVSWWKAEGNANDSAGSNNGTAINGVTYAAGKVGQAFSLNGTNQAVAVPDGIIPNTARNFTVSAWVYPNDVSYGFIYYGGANAGEYDLLVSSGNFYFCVNLVGSGSQCIDSPATSATDAWYQVVGIRRGTALEIWVNGVMKNSIAIPDADLVIATWDPTGFPSRIGAYHHAVNGDDHFWSGLIDEVKLYNRSLTASEVANLAGFNFISQTGMPLSTTIVSNPVTVNFISSDSAISVSGGGEYEINGSGTWTTSSGTISPGNTVKVRQTSSSSNSILTTSTLTIGGVTSDFNVTTAASGDPDASGLVAWWKAENNAYDSVGGNHGTDMNGATYAAGKVNQAFSFDGMDDYVQTNYNFPFTSDFTIGVWVKPQQIGDLEFVVGTEDGFGASCGGWSITWNVPAASGKFGFAGGCGGAENWTASSTANSYAIDQWHHVVAMFEGAVGKIYVDGVLDVQFSRSCTVIAGTNLRMGMYPNRMARAFKGLIDEVKIFNRALTALEVSTLAGTKPDAFSFSAQAGMPVSTTIVSNPITVTGIINPAAISITGGDYKVNGGSWTSSPGMVNNGGTVMVRQTSSANYSTLTTATLTIGGVNGAFNVTSAASVDPNASGLVAWWKAENNAYDSVGGNHGTPQGGVSYATGQVGQAFSLDGVDDYVDVPNSASLNPASAITVAAWYRPVTFKGNGSNAIVSKGFTSHAEPYYQYHIGVNGDQYNSATARPASFSFTVSPGGNRVVIETAENTWIPGNWYYLVGIYDGNEVKLYVNGVLKASTSATGTLTDYGKSLRIGAFNNISSSIDYTPGLIDEVKVYNRALSASEVAKLAGKVPDAFSFIAQTGMPLNTSIVSNPITVTGIITTAISITGGEYQINSGSWTASAGTVSNGDTVMVRLTSSGSYSALTTATLTIGGVSGAFNVTTAALGDPNASGLVSWWRAENNAFDSVGGNHGAPMNGATYATGRVGQAFSLESSGYVSVPDSLSLNITTAITITAWINQSACEQPYCPIVAKSDSDGGGRTWGMWLTGAGASGGVGIGALHVEGAPTPGSAYAFTGPGVISDNTFTHVAAVITTGGGINIYINGQPQVVTHSGIPQLTSNNVPLTIGYSDPGHNYFFPGLIDEVKIFNRALSASEVGRLYGIVPDPFTFVAVTGALLSRSIESNSISVTGTSLSTTISITAGGQYEINGSGIWLSTAGTVSPGDTVKVHLNSSPSYSTTTTATLTIGGVPGIFSVTTLADTEKPVVTTFTLHTAVSSAMSVAVDAFVATDNDIVSGYLVTDTDTPPAADDPGWNATTPATVTLSTAGDNILRAWAKDPAGNVSDALTATVLLKPVRREPDNDYVSLQTAYGEAGSGETIRALAVTLTETIDLNQPRDISISGGYEDGYAGQSGYSTISGSLTVGKGTLTVERIILK
jgi:hypothetical protein